MRRYSSYATVNTRAQRGKDIRLSKIVAITGGGGDKNCKTRTLGRFVLNLFYTSRLTFSSIASIARDFLPLSIQISALASNDRRRRRRRRRSRDRYTRFDRRKKDLLALERVSPRNSFRERFLPSSRIRRIQEERGEEFSRSFIWIIRLQLEDTYFDYF